LHSFFEPVPLQKFTTLLEDILEAEDSLPPGVPLSTLGPGSNHVASFFSHLTADTSTALLHPTVISKMSTYLSQITRPSKRARLAPTRGPGSGSAGRRGQVHSNETTAPARLAETDPSAIGRALKLLGRTVALGSGEEEYGDPFVSPTGATKETSASPSKKTKKTKANAKKEKPSKATVPEPVPTGEGLRRSSRSRSRSRTPMYVEEGDEAGVEDGATAENVGKVDQETNNRAPSEEELEKLDLTLDTAKESVLAASCVLALLSADKLPKQVRP
jgi:cohesin loading factor subunit SCC2